MKLGKALVFCAGCLSAFMNGCGRNSSGAAGESGSEPLLTPLAVIEEAYSDRRCDIPVTLRGTIRKVLRDDNEGGRHQRFILELENGQTLLVTHNIDIAPRVEGISPGDIVTLHGEYVFNEQGGIIHWTHHDPNASHEGGWILHDGKQYR